MALPKVLTHNDFRENNLIVHAQTYHLLGVIDWREATIEPFGVNLYSMQLLMGRFHLRDGVIRYDDYDALHSKFWEVLEKETSGWNGDDTNRRSVELAMVLGLLRLKGFTARYIPSATPVPIGDDANSAYNMLGLDGWLVNPKTKFI